ncbi:nuclear transport factor 2 family protein [Microbacterium rhizomatis]|nr:nuclear transport factor 2 family protein [Microbacterium rhizomatis]
MGRLTAEELLSRAEIADTLHAYSRGVDRRDIDLLADLFTDDATFDYGNGRIISGRDDLRALFVSATGRYKATSHHVSTIAYPRLEAGSASTLSYVYAFHDTGEMHFHLWGCYEDELVDDGDRWRIVSRKVRTAGARTTPSEELPERFERYLRAEVD